MPVLISLCIIARNEGNLIGQCIKSALPYVHQVVVVDTGSSDRTPDIARELGAEVWEFPWINDFSAARNFSLEKARGHWVLVMDCDEEIDCGTGENLPAAVQSDNYDAYFMNIKNFLGMDKEVTYSSIRLFRNNPLFRYEGKIHEQISGSILRHAGKDRIGRLDFTLLHHGYNAEKVNIKAKIVRNVNLLEEQKITGLQDGFFLYNMGIEHIRQGKFQQALENFIESLKITSINSGFAPILANKTVVCLIQLGRYRDALEQLAYFQGLYPGYGDLYLLEAACHLRCGRYTKAAAGIAGAQSASCHGGNYPVEGIIFGRQPEKILAELQPLLLSGAKKFHLSVCVLARNEEKNIARCVRSAGELADEIILVDTGSTDSTLHIAYQMGVQLVRLKWQDSFAELRNFVLQRTSGEWIIFLNGDEELSQADLPALVEGLNNSSVTGYRVKLRTFYDPVNSALYQDQAVCRIIRKDQDLQYRCRMVEDIDQLIKEKYGESALSCLGVTVFHYGPVLKHGFKKDVWQRNLRLIAGDLKSGGDKAVLYHAMGNEFYKLGKLKAALAHYQRAMAAAGTVSGDLYCRAINSMFGLGDYSQGLKVAEESAGPYPDYTDIIYLRGGCHLRLGNLDAAAECFRRCLELGDADWKYYAVQPGVGSYLAHCGLAEAYLKRGDLTKGVEHYRLAAAYPPGITFALPSLVELIIKHFGPCMVMEFLRDNRLDSCRHMCSAAITANKRGCLPESLELLRAAVETAKKENDPGQYQIIIASIYQILGNVYQEAVRHNPGCNKLQKIAKFFRQ